jgi:hypothetical protein
MRLDRETRMLALCPSEGPSSLRQGQGGAEVVARRQSKASPV